MRNAATGAAEIEAKHEARPLWCAAMVERINAQRAMQADDVSGRALDELEARAPDQRAVAEHPQILGRVIEAGIQGSVHCGIIPIGARLKGRASCRNRLDIGSKRRNTAIFETPHSAAS